MCVRYLDAAIDDMGEERVTEVCVHVCAVCVFSEGGGE